MFVSILIPRSRQLSIVLHPIKSSLVLASRVLKHKTFSTLFKISCVPVIRFPWLRLIIYTLLVRAPFIFQFGLPQGFP